MKNQMNRRDFFGKIASFAGAAVVAPTIINTLIAGKARAQTKRGAGPSAGGELPLVDPKDPIAKAVKYADDAKNVAEAKGNICSKCSFYLKKEDRNGKEVGTCTIFAGKVVAGQGWCASWNKKA